MRRAKSTSKSEVMESDNQKEFSVIQGEKVTPATVIRIIYQGASPKLTSRGHGDLSYELGVDDTTSKTYLRISGNASSGAFSREWLELIRIQSLLVQDTEQGKSLSAVAMSTLFTRKSANNCGYLAAILSTEGVLKILPGKPVMLGLGEWAPLLQKIQELKNSGVSLTDHIAIANQQKVERKSQLAATMKAAHQVEAHQSAKTDTEGAGSNEGQDQNATA